MYEASVLRTSSRTKSNCSLKQVESSSSYSQENGHLVIGLPLALLPNKHVSSQPQLTDKLQGIYYTVPACSGYKLPT